MSVERLAGLVSAARTHLYDAREKRVHPGLDDKVLASWNGLALAAFAEAGRALGRADYIAAAVKNARTSHSTACTGFLAVTTRSAANTRIAAKR